MNATTETTELKPITSALLTDAEITAVQDILMEQLNVKREQVTADADIEADLGADSLDKVEIVMRTEERFNVTLLDDQVEPVRTVEQLHEVLAKALGR